MSYRIHPGVGIARIGNSPDQFFIGPERPGQRMNPPGGFKDAQCRIKRQAARFRIFEYDDADPTAEPVDVTEEISQLTDITWTVNVANDRQSLSNFNRTATASGRLARTTFDPFDPTGATGVPVGEIRTDEKGRLIVLGGLGSYSGMMVGSGWDDLCDGPVTATFTLPGSTEPEVVTGSWVVVAPPRYAPDFDHIVTLYDVAFDLAVRGTTWSRPPQAFSATVTFGEHIYPILRRADMVRWLRAGALDGIHDWTLADLQDDDLRSTIFDRLRVPAGVTPSPGPGPHNMPQITALSMPFTLTPTQYDWMRQFADPDFVVPDPYAPPAPGPISAHGLDRAALEACCGGPFEYGVEVSPHELGSAPDPFRTSHTDAGSMTQLLDRPWPVEQLGGGCTQYWPVARPGRVKTAAGDQSWTRAILGASPSWHAVGFITRQGDEYVETERCEEITQIALLTPFLEFGAVPERPVGSAMPLMAIVFEVTSTTEVNLRFVAGSEPSSPFSAEVATVTIPATGPAPVTARLWVRYTTTTPGDSTDPPPVVRVEHVEEPTRTWDISLHGATVARPRTATALVLDRSGSMTESRGDTLSKYDSLREAAKTFLDLALDDDLIQLVRYDHEAQTVPASDFFDVSAGEPTVLRADPDPDHDTRQLLKQLIDRGDFAPAGSTSIGDGIHVGRGRLDAITTMPAPSKAILVLTDGKENTPRYISEVAGEVDAQTYAIGFGTPENTSAPHLQALAGNHGGYLLITGAIDAATNPENHFLLEKYFLQVLAGINKAEIVLDPAGVLVSGREERVPFYLTEADAGFEAILLCPRIREVDFRVVTPSGRTITPALAATDPAMHHASSTRAAFYRVALPTEIGLNRFDQAGLWHAVLRFGKPQPPQPPPVSANHYSAAPSRAFALRAAARSAPYALVVNAYSNLILRAALRQTGFDPGARVELTAALTNAGVLPVKCTRAWVELSRPDGTSAELDLAEVAGDPATYTRSFVAAAPGIYRCRVRAQALSREGYLVTRERTLTAAVWHGGDREAANPLPGSEPPKNPAISELLCCLTNHRGEIPPALANWLAREGVDMATFKRCLERLCKSRAPSALELARAAEAARTKRG
jgi:hypothetical protein